MADGIVRHPDYTANYPRWKKVRDFVGGEYVVKEAGTEYLPKLSAQAQSDYDSMKLRTEFCAATQKTFEVYTGLIFNLDPYLEPDNESLSSFDRYFPNYTSFLSFCIDLVGELLITSRIGILIDFNDNGPYAVLYTAENIINWRFDSSTGQLVELMLRETYDSNNTDSTNLIDIEEPNVVERYRHLSLVDGVYRQTVLTPTSSSNSSFTQRSVDILVRQEPLDSIPFLTNIENYQLILPQESLLSAVCSLNHSHYLTSADLEYGRHFAALPTPWASGFNVEGDSLRIGVKEAWITDNVNARAGYLEFTGAGLGSLERGLDSKEKKMASLGTNTLIQSQNSPESGISRLIKTVGERGSLATIVSTASILITNCLNSIYRYNFGRDFASRFRFNHALYTVTTDPAVLAQLLSLYTAGTISRTTLFSNLKRQNIVDADRHIDAEFDEIDSTMNLFRSSQDVPLDSLDESNNLDGLNNENENTDEEDN